MADTFSTQERSQIMSKVKSKKNKSTELKLISFFKSRKIKGWRRNSKLFGKPDFVFPALRVAIFVDGCFWHGHMCRNVTPASNKDYWTAKIDRNKKRDILVSETITAKNWKVIRIWECTLRKQDILETELSQLLTKDNITVNTSTNEICNDML